MASISKDAKGNVTIQFVGGDKRRRSIRLGKINAKTADEVKLKVEHLNALPVAKMPMDTDTARWVSTIGDDLAAKLAAVGLIPARLAVKLGEFLKAYFDRRKADAKPATFTAMRTCRNDVIDFFGENTDLRSVTEQRADDFRTFLLSREPKQTRQPKLASATVARRLKTVRQLFEHARRMKLIDANPFRDVKAASTLPEERRHYISAADATKLIAASPMWRIIIALCRYAGLRCPSEVLSLKWEHINFETARMTVPSPKTEHHAGKAYRACPIFALLRPHLDEAFELADAGAVYVVGGRQGDAYRAASDKPGGWNNCNMRTTFEKLIRRAGLTQWPRIFHNLRASCETDLVADHPFHAVCVWLGNTPAVAVRHYLQVLDRDFEKASGRSGAESGAVVVQNPVQSEPATSRHETTAARGPKES